MEKKPLLEVQPSSPQSQNQPDNENGETILNVNNPFYNELEGLDPNGGKQPELEEQAAPSSPLLGELDTTNGKRLLTLVSNWTSSILDFKDQPTHDAE